MQPSKHTPGVWHASRNAGCRSIGPMGERNKIRSICTTDGIEPDGEDEANALLISCAPAMYWALRMVLDRLTAWSDSAEIAARDLRDTQAVPYRNIIANYGALISAIEKAVEGLP